MKRLYIIVGLLCCILQCLSCSSTNNGGQESNISTSLTDAEGDEEEEDDSGSMSERVQRALDKGDYQKAYAIVDDHMGNIFDEEEARELNEKILIQEIAALIDKDVDGSSASSIVYAITERAKYNKELTNKLWGPSEDEEIKKLLMRTITIAEANGNTALVEKLCQSLMY